MCRCKEIALSLYTAINQTHPLYIPLSCPLHFSLALLSLPVLLSDGSPPSPPVGSPEAVHGILLGWLGETGVEVLVSHLNLYSVVITAVRNQVKQSQTKSKLNYVTPKDTNNY